jgi:hypothetical protein
MKVPSKKNLFLIKLRMLLAAMEHVIEGALLILKVEWSQIYLIGRRMQTVCIREKTILFLRI